MVKSKRVRRSVATWRGLFSRQTASGLTVAEFCRDERINANVFRRWRSQLNAANQRARPREAVSVAEAAPFIEIGALGSTGSRFEVRLDLGGGMVLSLVRS